MFYGDIQNLTKSNNNFRQVLQTGQHAQIVAMSLPVGGDIGSEVHQDTDQIFVIGQGVGEATVNNETQAINEQSILLVPAGSTHNIKNMGDTELKLLTIYSPPAHPDGTVQATKE